MVVRLDKLEFAFFFGKKLLDKFCGLIVHYVDFWLVPPGLQHFEVSLVRVENTFCRPGLQLALPELRWFHSGMVQKNRRFHPMT